MTTILAILGLVSGGVICLVVGFFLGMYFFMSYLVAAAVLSDKTEAIEELFESAKKCDSKEAVKLMFRTK